MIITEKDIESIDQKYWDDHQVDGITFNRRINPQTGAQTFDTGADNALFTGFYLAAASFRYGATKDKADLHKIKDTIDAIYFLTHITGTPGVLVRLAFPLDGAKERIGYDRKNQDPRNTWTKRRLEGSLYETDTHFYYTKTTRDQLTGVVYGLAVAWKILNEIPKTKIVDECMVSIQTITRDLVMRLKNTNWSLEDHTGHVGKTNAHKPKHQLISALLHLNHVVNGKSMPTFRLKMFYKFLWLHTCYYIFTRRMYAWNLRTAIAYSLWVNQTDSQLQTGAVKWIKHISQFTKNEDNAFFVFTECAMRGVHQDRIAGASRQLEKLFTSGHNSFFAWQKSKGEAKPAGENDRYGPGIDILLPYWARAYQLRGRGRR